MRRRGTRKFVTVLRKELADQGVRLAVEAARGRGNHVRLVIEDPKGRRGLCLVINGCGEISPGVQRRIKAAMAERTARGAVSTRCCEAVEAALTEAGRAEGERKEDLFDMARREFCSERVRAALVD